MPQIKRNHSSDANPFSPSFVNFKSPNRLIKKNFHVTSYSGDKLADSGSKEKGLIFEGNKNITLTNLKMVSKSELIKMIQNKNNQIYHNSTQSSQGYNNFNRNNFMTKKVDFNSMSVKNDIQPIKDLPSINQNTTVKNQHSNRYQKDLDNEENRSPYIKKSANDIDFSKIKHKIVEKYKELKNNSNNNLISVNV